MKRGQLMVSLCNSENKESRMDCSNESELDEEIISFSKNNDDQSSTLSSTILVQENLHFASVKETEEFYSKSLEIEITMEECSLGGTEIGSNRCNNNSLLKTNTNENQNTDQTTDSRHDCDSLVVCRKENFTILNYESAPPTVQKEYTSPIQNINPPPSAPLPARSSPLSLEMSIAERFLSSAKVVPEEIEFFSSPIRESSPISGVMPLIVSESENPYSDSESSWIPDSDEEKIVGSLRKKIIYNKDIFNEFSEDEGLIKLNSRVVATVKTPEVFRDSLTGEESSQSKLLENNGLPQFVNTIVTTATIHEKPHLIHRNNFSFSNITKKQSVKVIRGTDSEDSDVISYPTEGVENAYEQVLMDEITIDNDPGNINTINTNDSTKENVDKKLKRRKQKNSTSWKRNIEISCRKACLPYSNKSGKLMPAKLPKPVTCSLLCRNKCNEKFDYEARLKICKDYWGTKDYNHQKDYLLKLITLKSVRRGSRSVAPEKQRANSREYSFYDNKIRPVRVCKKFFIATLCISNGPIETAIKSISNLSTFDGTDKRGGHRPANKTNEVKEVEVKVHIEKFPTVESHYCRKKSKRLYLDTKLSIRKMYHLYEEEMKRNGKEPVKFNVYHRIFCNDYNYSFFKPKKDQCLTCNTFCRNQNPDVNAKKVYNDHIKRKDAAYVSKEADKKRSNENPNFLFATMDLQSVLQIPATSDSLLYYSRKLNVYNLSIYESKSPNRGHCLIWTEINGKRGSTEIASAINKWLKGVPSNINEIVLYSDTCAGQNRNQYLAAFFMYVVQASHLSVIEQKYLESGHSFMEVDSMHSAIDSEKKNSDVFSITDWKRIMRGARSQRHNKKTQPYQVQELSFHDMIDVKSLTDKFMNNRNTCTNGNKIQWLKIKCLRFEKSSPGYIKFRYGYDGPYYSFDALDTSNKKVVRTRSKVLSSPSSCIDLSSELKSYVIPAAYSALLPISKAKKKDLLSLCKKGIIPDELHQWYKSLPSSSVQDTLEDDLLLSSENEED